MRRNILKKTHKMQAKKIKKETKIYINFFLKKKNLNRAQDGYKAMP